MKTISKGINFTGMHFLDLQLLQDKRWMKNEQFNEKKGKVTIYYDTHFVLPYNINSLCIAIYRYIVTLPVGSSRQYSVLKQKRAQY